MKLTAVCPEELDPEVGRSRRALEQYRPASTTGSRTRSR